MPMNLHANEYLLIIRAVTRFKNKISLLSFSELTFMWIKSRWRMMLGNLLLNYSNGLQWALWLAYPFNTGVAVASRDEAGRPRGQSCVGAQAGTAPLQVPPPIPDLTATLIIPVSGSTTALTILPTRYHLQCWLPRGRGRNCEGNQAISTTCLPGFGGKRHTSLVSVFIQPNRGLQAFYLTLYYLYGHAARPQLWHCLWCIHLIRV